METFEQFMIMENAIDDIQIKYIRNNPDKRKLINQAFEKYRLIKQTGLINQLIIMILRDIQII